MRALCGVFVRAARPSHGPLGGESARNPCFGLRLGGREGLAQLRSRIQVSCTAPAIISGNTAAF